MGKPLPLFTFRRLLAAMGMLMLAHVYVLPSLSAQGKPLVSQISPVAPHATLLINTKYTDLDFQTWDQAQIEIEAALEGQILSAVKDFPLTSYVQLHVNATEDRVEIRTDYSAISAWRSSLNRIEWELKDGKRVLLKNFRIKLRIKAPASLALMLRSSYGQITLAAHEASADIRMRHGKLYAEALGPRSNLELSYIKGRLAKLFDAQLDISHTQYEIGVADVLKVKGKFSHLSVDSLAHLESESKYFSYAIGSLNTLRGKDRNINMAIGILRQTADWELSFSNIAIKALAPSFKQLRLDSDHTHVELSVLPLPAYTLQLSNSQGSLRFPRTILIQEDKLQGSTRRVSATLGKNPQALLEIKTNYGDVVIK